MSERDDLVSSILRVIQRTADTQGNVTMLRLATAIADDQLAVWRFARDFARTSGDGPTCQCVNCCAYRAVRDDEGAL